MKIDVTKLPLGEALIGFVLVAVVLTFALAFASTSGGGIESEEVVAGPTPGAASSDEGTAGGSVAVSMGDNFFDSRELTVAAGDTVTFDLTNDGIAIHNMRVAGLDGEYNSDDDTVSDPDLFLSGDTGILTWQAPDQTGEIIFRCDFHPIEMVGTITVE
jgi:plastocyanin